MTKKTVAVVGINGAIGKDLLEVLTSHKPEYFNYPIRAITRDISKTNSPPEGVELKEASFNDPEALKKALDSVDVVIDLTSSGVSSSPLIDAAVATGVKLYFPSEYGSSHSKSKYPNPYKVKEQTVSYARDKGLKAVQLHSGFFADWELANPAYSGVFPSQNLYRKIEGGDFQISLTFIRDIAYSLSELAHLDPSQIPDEVFVESDSVTDNYIAELWEKYNSVKLTVENVSKNQIEKEAEEANSKFDKDIVEDLMGFLVITRASSVDGSNDHSINGHNELVNPGEKNFKWTKVSNEAKRFMTGEAPAAF